ncbi:hypothetical protein AURDEDRAFT_51183, partial [Auricularia subglabra TFB-10046 SS5]
MLSTYTQSDSTVFNFARNFVSHQEFKIVDRAFLESLDNRSVIDTGQSLPSELVSSVLTEFQLNCEQQRAFKIVAEHFICGVQAPLRMYLAGMAGTGKSRVIHALTTFFERANSGNCLLLLAPTGTAAANIGGYTYHCAFGLGSENRTPRAMKHATRTALSNIKYIFIDEVSMISCTDMRLISERLSMVHNVHTEAFGG